MTRTVYQSKGFTLIELVAIVGLLAMLVSVAMPRMDWDLLGKIQSESISQQFLRYLRHARCLAIAHSGSNAQGFAVVISKSSRSFYVVDQDSRAKVGTSVKIPAGVSFSGSRKFQFTPLGELKSLVLRSVTFKKNGFNSIIEVSPVGQIRLQD